MSKDQALRLALEALEESHPDAYRNVITSLRQAIAEAEKQKPVACIGTNGELMWVNKPKVIYSKPQPLYKFPPKREWQGLTEEEKGWCAAPTMRETIERVEAKLKEKNT